MSDALDYVRNSCGIAGEQVAQMVDERDQCIDDLSRGRGELARRVVELEISLRIKTEEHDCCAEDNIELRKQLAACEKERDEAIAHDRQPYPTAWAYEQVCKALQASQAREQQLHYLLKYARLYLRGNEISTEDYKNGAPRLTEQIDAIEKELGNE